MSIVTSLLSRLGFLASLKSISFGSALKVIGASFPRAHATTQREWYSARDAEQFQINMLQRRDFNDAVGRRPIAR